MAALGVSLGHQLQRPDVAPGLMPRISPQGPGGEGEPLLPLPGLADGLLAEGTSPGWGEAGAPEPLPGTDAQPVFCCSTLPR